MKNRRLFAVIATIATIGILMGLTTIANADIAGEAFETEIFEEESNYDSEQIDNVEELEIDENLEIEYEQMSIDDLVIDEFSTIDENECQIPYDVNGYELDGWWIPSIIYNDDDTISFYLEDDTCFITTPMAGMGREDSVWQGTGLWGYVEFVYGGEANLSPEEYSTYISVIDLLS
ncbi:MAG: hypothetical protein MJ094_03270 [Saccharofermentans sp.]|nr:hypothetical protein [Saccharofermentans sp.]